MLLSADSAEDLLAYRKADLIFSIAPINNRSMVCVPYVNYRMILVCSQDHPRLQETATLEELQKEKFTIFLSDEAGVKHYQSKTEEVHADRTIGFRCDSLFSIMAMISASHLVGYIPEVLYEKYRDVLRLKKLTHPLRCLKWKSSWFITAQRLTARFSRSLLSRLRKNKSEWL